MRHSVLADAQRWVTKGVSYAYNSFDFLCKEEAISQVKVQRPLHQSAISEKFGLCSKIETGHDLHFICQIWAAGFRYRD